MKAYFLNDYRFAAEFHLLPLSLLKTNFHQMYHKDVDCFVLFCQFISGLEISVCKTQCLHMLLLKGTFHCERFIWYLSKDNQMIFFSRWRRRTMTDDGAGLFHLILWSLRLTGAKNMGLLNLYVEPNVWDPGMYASWIMWHDQKEYW